jgi:hypothetical protein
MGRTISWEAVMERTSLCVACEYYSGAVSLSVDPACCSTNEADALCAPHRAKMTVMPSSA